MYWGMSPSRIWRAAVYFAFPPVGVGAVPVAGLVDAKSLSWVPPSSQYCSQRSLSRISAAARNRRIEASPFPIFPPKPSFLASALVANKALAGSNTAPVAPRPLRNERLPTTGGLACSEFDLPPERDCDWDFTPFLVMNFFIYSSFAKRLTSAGIG